MNDGIAERPSIFHEPPRRLGWVDLAVVGMLAAFIFLLITVARQWVGPMQEAPAIELDAKYLPLYALYSLSRGVMAYIISFFFTMVYGYAMARVAGAERVMLPLLDILQSIPVLGFLPGFVLALVQLFPHQRIGLELASVLMIFTGQVWNMTFSFYSSLKSVPPDLLSVARLARMSWWERFTKLDLSFAATGLLWNSMMSMAGGWFFLMVSEAFVLGNHDFRLPGLGSYMSLAIEREDRGAQILGILTMLGMIAFVDQLVWRPLVAWSHKFTDDDTSVSSRSWLWEWIRTSRLWAGLSALRLKVKSWQTARPAREIRSALPSLTKGRRFVSVTKTAGLGLLIVAILFGAVKYLQLLTTVTLQGWGHLFQSTAATFARVITAVALATLWTLPIGVLIGRHPRLSRLLQPMIQMAASFPAPMIFPIAVGLLAGVGAGLGLSSVVLLMLGAQWYVLFNVIAGAAAIPRELWEVSALGRFSWRQRWQKLILPALFPSLLTGWITATGGAWNASIVAEYMTYHGATLKTLGLGAAISDATARGDFQLLGAAVGIMAVAVVSFNRVVWRPLSHQAQTRFSMDT